MRRIDPVGDGSDALGPELEWTKTPVVRRHLTALRRARLSTPIKALLMQGELRRERSLFDYGCGRGDDVRLLRAEGFDATGWDPFYAPSAEKRDADLVNLGFVLNVIEGIDERRLTLIEAYSLARHALVVSTLVPAPRARARRFNDGFLTTRMTFQRDYRHDELEAFIRETLEDGPSLNVRSVGRNVFIVFAGVRA